jgi:hypothetical protein
MLIDVAPSIHRSSSSRMASFCSQPSTDHAASIGLSTTTSAAVEKKGLALAIAGRIGFFER